MVLFLPTFFLLFLYIRPCSLAPVTHKQTTHKTLTLFGSAACGVFGHCPSPSRSSVKPGSLWARAQHMSIYSLLIKLPPATEWAAPPPCLQPALSPAPSRHNAIDRVRAVGV